jgi:nitroreductase
MTDMIRLPVPAALEMTIGEAMFTQRAIRRLKPDPIPDEHVRLILEAATKAPNGGNAQPARFLVIRDAAKRAAFAELYHEAWWAKRRDGPGWKTKADIPPEEKGYLSAARLADEIGIAPVVVLAFSPHDSLGHSVYPAVQNLLLAARALGIGSVLTTLHPDVMERVHALFDIPSGMVFHACIPLGYPRGRFGPTSRLPISDVVYLDRWGDSPSWQ